MGAPTSSIYAVLKYEKIIMYFSYVDDILIIYDQNKTKIEQTLDEFNRLQLSVTFTVGKELHKVIKFFHLTIHHRGKTNNMIRNSPYHPYEHKVPGINYLLNLLHTFPITRGEKET
jgi:hypothetical protein